MARENSKPAPPAASGRELAEVLAAISAVSMRMARKLYMLEAILESERK